jgi:diguanylate cyclase (GGDEF)-like protein/PAS domain S-box-containing protein
VSSSSGEPLNELPGRLSRRSTAPAEIIDIHTSLTFEPNATDVLTRPDAVVRLEHAEDTLRAIAAGEVDAFVVSDGGSARRIFTLSTADRPYRKFVENMRDGAATLSSDGLILYANRRLAELLGRPREKIVGSTLTAFVAGGAMPGLEHLCGLDGEGATFELDLVDVRGSAIAVLVGSSPLDVDGDQLTCLTFADLSLQRAQDRLIAQLRMTQDQRLADLQDAQAALTRQATHDALTGLPNRALLVDRIDQALMQARRSQRSTAILFVDLDRFKRVNDTRGHAAGDALLRQVANQLVGAVRSMDTVARIGGDEFVVLLPNVEDGLHAVDIGERLLHELSRSHSSHASAPVAASIGLSISLAGKGDAEMLLEEADTAMYAAKARGGRVVGVFDAALSSQLQHRLIATGIVQAAIDEQRIIAHYQPIIELASSRLAGFEALARIPQDNGELLAPASFIPAAEESGLVIPLGSNILRIACAEAHDWPTANGGDARLTVAVNVSPRQFEPGDLVDVVRQALSESGLSPGRLHLELTETAIIDLRPDIIQQLNSVRDLGVEIGLDDFGTGYASLTHLRRLPLSFVKIDQSFVTNVDTNDEDARIVSAVVDLAANLGLRSIAEGVEDPTQRDRLIEIGCDQAQGYLFARPVPAAHVPELIGARRDEPVRPR